MFARDRVIIGLQGRGERFYFNYRALLAVEVLGVEHWRCRSQVLGHVLVRFSL